MTTTKENVQHIVEHGIEKDDVAHVIDCPVGIDTSDSSKRPITAFEVPEPH